MNVDAVHVYDERFVGTVIIVFPAVMVPRTDSRSPLSLYFNATCPASPVGAPSICGMGNGFHAAPRISLSHVPTIGASLVIPPF